MKHAMTASVSLNIFFTNSLEVNLKTALRAIYMFAYIVYYFNFECDID